MGCLAAAGALLRVVGGRRAADGGCHLSAATDRCHSVEFCSFDKCTFCSNWSFVYIPSRPLVFPCSSALRGNMNFCWEGFAMKMTCEFLSLCGVINEFLEV